MPPSTTSITARVVTEAKKESAQYRRVAATETARRRNCQRATPEQTIGLARTALHQAKRTGRNRVVVVAKNQIDPSQASRPAPSL